MVLAPRGSRGGEKLNEPCLGLRARTEEPEPQQAGPHKLSRTPQAFPLPLPGCLTIKQGVNKAGFYRNLGRLTLEPLNLCVFLTMWWDSRSVLFCTFPMYEFPYSLDSVAPSSFRLDFCFLLEQSASKWSDQKLFLSIFFLLGQFPRSCLFIGFLRQVFSV